MKFQDVKVGDTLIMEYGDYRDPEFYIIKVTNVTKTRFKTTSAWRDGVEQTWSKDGHTYPRSRDVWSRRTMILHFETEELKEKMAQSKMRRILRNEMGALEDQIADFRRNHKDKDLTVQDMSRIRGFIKSAKLALESKEKPQE